MHQFPIEHVCHACMHASHMPDMASLGFAYNPNHIIMTSLSDRIPSTSPGAEPPRDARDSGSARSHSAHLDRIPSTTPGAAQPRDARDSGSARSHSMHLETSSSDRP